MTIKAFLFCIMAVLLSSCSNQPVSKNTLKTYTVQAETLRESLAFSGTIQPLQEWPVTSPIDGVISAMPVHYGQQLSKTMVILSLDSPELQKQYNENLTEYLKAKDNYNVSRAKFNGTEDLWQAGLISKNNYLSEQSSLATAQMTLMQATSKLADMLAKMDESAPDFTKLSLTEFDKVRQALNTNHNIIHLKAPAAGLFLYPPKAGNDATSQLSVGSSVKAGQVLGLIGDMSGISIEIEVPEIDVTKITPGMKANIRGIAFAQPLHGQLIRINPQATSASGSLPFFNALIEVRNLDLAQQQSLKVGMSAAVELEVQEKKQLLIPLSALHWQDGKNTVQIKDSKGQLVTREVATGAAKMDKVAITHGLRAGDVVVYG